MTVDDQHRAVRVVKHLSTGATEEHPTESATTASTQDNQLRSFGVIHEIPPRPVLHDDGVDADIWVAIGVASETFGE